jgi:hypothetical protein
MAARVKRLALLALIALALWVRLRVTFRPYEPDTDYGMFV